MFGSHIEFTLTNDEKLDYIYTELKKWESDRRWSRIWKWIWRFFLIGSTFWLYLHPEIIFDMTKWLTGNITNSLIGLPTDLRK